ncbi:hypothetical protein EG68_01854 [Paragonimus skrjabini miyazakii]|uniref:RAB interacting factor n=2 Tax=Paragonimus TaxID=34503 RepID=A0A8J4SK71_9TREM|nr:RAB interacting factor [Paragonimus heterotremus]KAF7260902.1 hypothetical protein EG68_01854 [Paragonimus skrjabini miyazakii]
MAAIKAAEQNGSVHGVTNGEGRNLFDICCPRCSSIVLKKCSANFTIKQQSLPVYAKKSELTNPTNEFPTDLLDQFWSVNDMYTFENVGFTHDVNSLRYLTCADCELGPIGFQDTNEGPPKVYYVALSRTTHKPSDSTEPQ